MTWRPQSPRTTPWSATPWLCHQRQGDGRSEETARWWFFATDGSFLFNSDLQAIGRGPTPLTLNGYPIATTNAVPSNLTKGSGSNLSAVVAGDFSQCMVGFYGNGLEIVVGEDSDDFAKGLSSVRGILSFDIGVRHAESFASIEDVST